MIKNDGGPAFPKPPSTEVHGYEHKSEGGMTLRDWFAGRESLSDLDDPQVSYPAGTTTALAGRPLPLGPPIAVLQWEADWRAALKYIRADAMIRQSQKGTT